MDKEKKPFHLSFEKEVAFPDVITGEVDEVDEEVAEEAAEAKNLEVAFDNLAVPEVTLKKKSE